MPKLYGRTRGIRAVDQEGHFSAQFRQDSEVGQIRSTGTDDPGGKFEPTETWAFSGDRGPVGKERGEVLRRKVCGLYRDDHRKNEKPLEIRHWSLPPVALNTNC